MEFILNLAWLLLTFPAYLVWRDARARDRHGLGSVTSLLALGCALILLFPVVSATDDLHPMQAEFEEPGTNQRGVRQATQDKASVSNSRWQTPPALPGVVWSLALTPHGWQELRSPALSVPAVPPVLRAGRAPPFCSLG
jgi:hypothetical protein